MRVVFCDVDGVLNYRGCGYLFRGFVGISPEKVKLLSKIVHSTDAKLVLSSTWRLDYSKQNDLGEYLKNSLAEENLEVYDCTGYSSGRGKEITDWLDAHPETDEWVVLDDEVFPDYEEYEIIPHLVKTSFYQRGLESKHVWKAIALLNGNIIDTMKRDYTDEQTGY